MAKKRRSKAVRLIDGCQPADSKLDKRSVRGPIPAQAYPTVLFPDGPASPSSLARFIGPERPLGLHHRDPQAVPAA